MSLSDLQRRVAALVLSVPEAAGFALAGGGALIIHEIVDRTTNDLDCFGPTRDAVDRLAPALHHRMLAEGFDVATIHKGHGFARFSVTDTTTGDTTLVDIGYDPADHDPVVTSIGSVRALEDLAGDKLLALFSRAAPRDFVDVHALRNHYTRRTLEAFAASKDLGFNVAILRDAFGVLATLPRNAFQVDDDTFAQLTAEFGSWADELSAL